jgi:uncharacterized protein (TIGR02466 family)
MAKAKTPKKTTEKSVGPLGIMAAFPTNVGLKSYGDTVADLNNRLRTKIYKNRGEDPTGVYRSNTAGTWHSDTELVKWIDEPDLINMFAENFTSYTQTYGVKPGGKIGFKLQAWAMLYQDGGYATVHTHPNCHFSGVYYIDNAGDGVGRKMVTGSNVHPGDIEFVDSRATGGYQFPGVNFLPGFRVQPQAGQMLIFPSWLQHFVHPVIGKEDRMCIACNATIVSNTPKKD